MESARVPYTYSQARALQNPVQSNVSTQRDAKALFETNCAACHGEGGRGDGPVAKYFKNNPTAPVPPSDLASAQVAERADGELYWIVTNGLGDMPAYRDQMTDQQLWSVVMAIRDLQLGQP